MPETASLAHTLTPVRSANESAGNLKPDDIPHKLKSNRADSAVNGDNNSISEQSSYKKGQKPDDFDKVLSRKIDGQKEQTPDEHPQENAAPAETAGLNPPRCPGCSDPGHGNNPLENMGEQGVPEQAIAEISNPLINTGDVQLAANTGIMGETMNPENQLNEQPSVQAQGTTVQSASPQSGLDPEKPVHAKITADPEVPVDGKQVHAQKAVMTESAGVSADNNTGAENTQNTESKQPQIPEVMEQARKQLSDASDSETRPVQTNQDKSVHPDTQAVLQGARQEQPRDFQSQSNNLGTAGQSQDETRDIKEPQAAPVEAETFSGKYDETPKGFEIRNVQSMLHSAEPAENASLSALEAPARTGIHSNIPQAETTKPVDQILQHLNSVSISGPQQRIKLTLTPEHLGTIRITFNQTEDEIVGLLEVQKNQTRRQVEQSLPQLISAMQSGGVQVRRIEVVQWNTSQDSAEDETAKDSDYSAAGQFYDESSPHSSESEMSENIRSAGGGQKSSQLSGISEQRSPIYGVDTTGDGLNMFI